MAHDEEKWSAEDQVDLYDFSGKVVYFGIRSFVENIANGDACFICGAKPGTVVFNDEHVIPDWILSLHQLYGQRIILPNRAGLKYGQYTVPCCQSCNSLMADTFERPISILVRQGYAAVIDSLQKDTQSLFFQWLALIFLKTHLKDRQLRFHLDQRKGAQRIAELYDWEDLHHIHCIARAFYTGAIISPEVLGTLFVWPTRSSTGEGDFDYGDSYAGRTILLRLGEIAFIAVLNDSKAVQVNFADACKRITGPLSSLQLRELMTRMAIVNMHVTERPQYRSSSEHTYRNREQPCELRVRGTYTISAALPEAPNIDEIDKQMLGALFKFNVASLITAFFPEEEREPMLDAISTGNLSFIWDEKGNFLVNPKPATEENVPKVIFRSTE